MALPASTRFFQLPELVDIVLQHLGKKTLLPLLRVNHLFKCLIERSKSLQDKLCLSTTPEKVVNNDPQSLHGMYQVKLNNFIYNIKVGEDGDNVQQLHLLTAAETQLLPKQLVVSADSSLWFRKEGLCFFLYTPQGLRKKHSTVVPSWRNMFLTQPPVTHVRVFGPCKASIRLGSIQEGEPGVTMIENMAGVKISDVLDAITEHADTEYLQIAPYAVQVVYTKSFKNARKQYRARLQEHLQDWRYELSMPSKP